MEEAGLYVRLSDEDEDKTNKEDFSKSIINQRAILEDYAKQQGFHVYEIYCDDDYSGLYEDRPAFRRMIRDARQGKINVIIAKTQSRFSRNMEHIEKYLYNRFIDWGVRFIGVVDGVDTANKANKKSSQVFSMTNEWYCEDVSDSVHAVFDSKMKRGEFIGSFAAYGYKKDPNNKSKLIIDEDAAEVVRRIFAMRISGASVAYIVQVLSEEKIPTPAVYKKQQGLTYRFRQKYNFCEDYGFWGTTTVRRILQNRVYLGEIVQGKTRKINYKSKKLRSMPKDKWVSVENMHEPIISQNDFELVQKTFDTRVRSGKESCFSYPLSGKLKCAECQSTLAHAGSNRDKTRTYLRCQLYKKSKGEFCTGHKVVMQDIENVVLQKIQDMINLVLHNEDNVDELSEILKLDDGHNKKDNIQRKLDDLEKEIGEVKGILQTMYLDKLQGIVSAEMYIEMSCNMDNKLVQLGQERKSLEEQMKVLREEENKVKDYCKMVREYCDVRTLTKEIVNQFIDYIEVSEDDGTEKQKLIIHWNI